MNREIQLHDSELSAVHQAGGVTSILFSTVYVHESAGVPGHDAGMIWTQSARITVEGTAPVIRAVNLPIWASSGDLRIGEAKYEEFIPAGGQFQEEVEFRMELSMGDGTDGGTLEIKGRGVKIELLGDPSDAEVFSGCPRRSVE